MLAGTVFCVFLKKMTMANNFTATVEVGILELVQESKEISKIIARRIVSTKKT